MYYGTHSQDASDHITVLDWALMDWAFHFCSRFPPGRRTFATRANAHAELRKRHAAHLRHLRIRSRGRWAEQSSVRSHKSAD